MGVWSGDNANVRSSLATEVKAAPRGVAEAFGYSVLRSEQADAIEKSVMSLYLFQLAQGREPMFCLPLVYDNSMRGLKPIIADSAETKLSPNPYSSAGVGSGD